MRILITGGFGFVGGRLAVHLVLAFGLMAYIMWTTLDINKNRFEKPAPQIRLESREMSGVRRENDCTLYWNSVNTI